MPTNTEELQVLIKTVADTSGAKQAQQALQQLTTAQQGANAALRAAMAQQAATLQNFTKTSGQIRSVFGTAPTLGPGAFGIAQTAAAAGGGARAAGGRGAGGALRDIGVLAGVGTGLYAAQHALQAIVGYLTDSVQLLREQQRLVVGTEALYASWSSQAKQLDDSFKQSAKSGDALQLTLGRMAAPSVQGGLVKQGQAADFLNEKLTGLARTINEQKANGFWGALLTEAEQLPFGLGQGAKAVEDLGTSLEKLDAQRAELQLRQAFRIGHDLTSTQETAQGLAQLARSDQVLAAVRDVTEAQQAQKDLQRESVNLAGEEARIRLSMLPTVERLAEAQRAVTEQQLLAVRAALPATERLEDLQYQQQRDRLIAANRLASVEDRSAARRDLRALTRAEPGVALAALEAGRPVTVAGRGAERVGIEAQLFQISNERALAQVTEQQTTNALLAQIAAQRTQAIELTINMGSEQFRTEFHAALQVVQGQKPAPIPLVGTGP